LSHSPQNGAVGVRPLHPQAFRPGRGLRPRLDSVRAGLDRSYQGRTAVSLDRIQPRPSGADPPESLQFVKTLGQADQAGAPAGGIDDDFGQVPVELLGQLEAHRLLALDAIGLRSVARLKTPILRHPGSFPPRQVDQTVHGSDLRSGAFGFGTVGGVRIRREDDVRSQPGARGVGRHRSAGVSGGGNDDFADPELGRTRKRDRHPAGLERSGRIEAFVLDVEVFESERGSQS
jgi:hypothetical protein